MKKHSLVLAYMTANDLAEAKRIARRLLQDRLAACVHVLPNVHSLYRWKGRRVSEREVVIVAKTKQSLARTFVEAVKKIHSYEVPCIVFLPIMGGNEKYLKWTTDETV